MVADRDGVTPLELCAQVSLGIWCACSYIVHVCVYVCVHVCTCMYMYVHVYMCVHVCVWIDSESHHSRHGASEVHKPSVWFLICTTFAPPTCFLISVILLSLHNLLSPFLPLPPFLPSLPTFLSLPSFLSLPPSLSLPSSPSLPLPAKCF